MARPLDGVRILDLTWAQQGPYATVLLSDMGAEIIKIEQREGEIGRRIIPADAGQLAAYFVAHSRGKRSVALDVRRPQGREVVLRLAERVDAVVNNMRSGVMERLGLGYEEFHAVNPRIVYASASAFGPLGELAELPGFDIVGQAMGGIMSKTGPEGAPPMPAGAGIADQVGAVFLCAGILGALLKAARTGEGEQVDVSLYGCQVALQAWEITQQAMLGRESGRAGTGHPLISPIALWGGYATSDGGLVLGGVDGERFRALCEIAEVPELAERYADDVSRVVHNEEIVAVLREKFRERPTAYWLEKLRAEDVMTAPVQSYADVITDPQARANGYIRELDLPGHGRTPIVGSPIQFGREPTLPQGPPPELGDHTEIYLEELGYTWEQIDELREAEVI